MTYSLAPAASFPGLFIFLFNPSLEKPNLKNSVAGGNTTNLLLMDPVFVTLNVCVCRLPSVKPPKCRTCGVTAKAPVMLSFTSVSSPRLVPTFLNDLRSSNVFFSTAMVANGLGGSVDATNCSIALGSVERGDIVGAPCVWTHAYRKPGQPQS